MAEKLFIGKYRVQGPEGPSHAYCAVNHDSGGGGFGFARPETMAIPIASRFVDPYRRPLVHNPKREFQERITYDPGGINDGRLYLRMSPRERVRFENAVLREIDHRLFMEPVSLIARLYSGLQQRVLKLS